MRNDQYSRSSYESDDAIELHLKKIKRPASSASSHSRTLASETVRTRKNGEGMGRRPADGRVQNGRNMGASPQSVRRTSTPVAGGSRGSSSGRKTAVKSRPKSVWRTVGKTVGRVLALALIVVLLAVIALFTTAKTVADGPSVTLRNQLVMMALQASATKWAPGLFLPEETVNEILNASKQISEEKIDIVDVDPKIDDPEKADEWKDAVNGVLYFTKNYSGFKAYIVIVRDPSRVFDGTSSDDYASAKDSMRIWDAAKRYDALIAINAGEFKDTASDWTGSKPIGLTYSRGKMVWDDGVTSHTFIGFDANDRMVVREGMTKKQAASMNIRDGVMFQSGNVLITNDGTTVTAYRRESDTGTAQRTAIGQRANGAVILMVTDGRTASSIGATKDDIIDAMLSLGAVTAGMLDGGSSSLLYYENYYDFYGIDKGTLDNYQLKGIVNKYKAFTTPRMLPTFFMVEKEEH